MLKIEKVIEKFKEVIPELLWKKGNENIYCYYFTNRFTFFKDGRMENMMPPELLGEYIQDDIENCPEESREKYEEDEWCESTFDSEEDLDFFLRNLRRYVDKCESVRHSDEDLNQIVFLHPDIPEDETFGFLRDFKYIVKSSDGYSIGIISTKDWDFRNEELIDLFCSSNGDALGIERCTYNDLDEDDVDLLLELYEKYPGKNTKFIYTTSYD